MRSFVDPLLVPNTEPPKSVPSPQDLPPTPTFFPTTTIGSTTRDSAPSLPQSIRDVTGFVFIDIDGDGRRSVHETTSAGAFVTITLPDGNRRTVVTDEQGRYRFPDLPTGRVTIEVFSKGLRQAWTVEVLGVTTRLDVPVAVEPTTLAFTGRQSRTELAVAVLLVVLGSALVSGGRRRRDSTTP